MNKYKVWFTMLFGVTEWTVYEAEGVDFKAGGVYLWYVPDEDSGKSVVAWFSSDTILRVELLKDK